MCNKPEVTHVQANAVRNNSTGHIMELIYRERFKLSSDEPWG